MNLHYLDGIEHLNVMKLRVVILTGEPFFSEIPKELYIEDLSI